MDAPTPDATTRNRKRGALAVAPLVGLAVFDLALLFLWGLDPLWAFAIVPPMLMISVFAWIYFSADHENSDGPP